MRRYLLSFSIGVGLVALGCHQAQNSPPQPTPPPVVSLPKSAVRLDVMGSSSYERLDVRVDELGPQGRGLLASGSYAPAQVPSAFALDSLKPEHVYQVTAIAREGAGTLAVASASIDFRGRSVVATQSLELFVPFRLETVAGAGGAGGYADGMGTGARFNAPAGLASDASGSVYIADTGNRLIRMLDASGSITTFAGIPYSQTATQSEEISPQAFLAPYGVSLARDGRVLVADQGRNQIRAITRGGIGRFGVVGDFAGQLGFTSFASGSAQTAIFNKPMGVAVLPDGTVAVTDTENHLIRAVTVNGQVVELAGMYVPYSSGGFINATGLQAAFRQPTGIVSDAKGNLYIADTGNHCIRKLTPQGQVTTYAGLAGTAGYADGDATTAKFNRPTSVALDRHGQLFVADSGNHCIRMVTPSGEVMTAAGQGGSAGFSDGRGANRLREPYGVALGVGDQIYVSDRGNNAIRRMR
ncbi:hypothetical protein J7643_08365 [bacterium]|nr:hypothetical protein [bacterium]